jgi:hypothetical protein
MTPRHRVPAESIASRLIAAGHEEEDSGDIIDLRGSGTRLPIALNHIHWMKHIH